MCWGGDKAQEAINENSNSRRSRGTPKIYEEFKQQDEDLNSPAEKNTTRKEGIPTKQSQKIPL